MQLLTGYSTLQEVLYCIPRDNYTDNLNFIVVRAGTVEEEVKAQTKRAVCMILIFWFIMIISDHFLLPYFFKSSVNPTFFYLFLSFFSLICALLLLL